MTINRNKLYSILLIACLAGYVWVYFNITENWVENNAVEVCLIKHATNIPCPSCGSTRSVISLAQGDFLKAFQTNPLGYLAALIMLLAPFWVLADIVSKRSTLYNFYRKVEEHIRKPGLAIPLGLLVIVNWIWNISKGL